MIMAQCIGRITTGDPFLSSPAALSSGRISTGIHSRRKRCLIVVGFPTATADRSKLRICTVRAEASGGDQGPSDSSSSSSSQYGLGGPGSFFGFGKFQERFVGRFAMVGFVAALVMEVVTGKGIFGQLGLDPLRVRYPMLLGFTFLLVGGLLGGYVVINNPPDESKAPPNAGDGIPRDPLKTFDANNIETLTTYTRGGVVERPSGQKGREPYVSDLDVKD